MQRIRFKRFLESTPIFIHLFAIISLLSWILKATWFDFLPPAFFRAHEIGLIVDAIFSAIIAGYVFLILFALLPAFWEREIISPIVSRNIRLCVGDCQAILNEINHVSGANLILTHLIKTEVEQAFGNVLWSSNPRMVLDISGTKASWFQYFAEQRRRTYLCLAVLERNIRYFDAELARLSSDIDANVFFKMSEAFQNLPHGNPNMRIFGDPFFDYATLCLNLARYHDTNFVPPENRILI